MNYRLWIAVAATIVAIVIILDETSYSVWRIWNRGEHWSHLTEKTSLTWWGREHINQDNPQLNRSWSGRF